MYNLLYKELRLAAHPSLYVFLFMGALVLIPAYPYGIVFFFGMLGIFQTMMYVRETRDIYFTALLPIPKRGVVKAKLLLAAFAQLTELAISLPFAFLRTCYLAGGNPVGIEANLAYYGIGLMIFGVFNIVFFPQFFKTAYKAGTAFIIAMIPATLGIIAMETLVHIPGLGWLDGIDAASLIRQIPLLLAGIAVYAITWFSAYRLSAKRFSQVNL